MKLQLCNSDAVVIGGGFYGAAIAVYLAKNRGVRRVILIEQDTKLLGRASSNNQSRAHNGYHYPRSLKTAFRSRFNFPRFLSTWPQTVKQDFENLYAISKRNSKVTAKQFERFCQAIGAKIKPADASLKNLFDSRLIEDVFQVEECVFDSTLLAEWAVEELKEVGVEVYYSTRALAITYSSRDNMLSVAAEPKSGETFTLSSQYVFNCTYSGLNQFSGGFAGTKIGLKHEVTELALIQVPEILKEKGVTVMDGPFFSIMPFPTRGLHTLSHVRYTPHFSWKDEKRVDPYEKLNEYNCATRVDRMVRDSARYLPELLNAKYIDSLFEVKTVLTMNEADDGRPTLFEKHEELPGCYSVLGGKIDNIFDVLEKLDAEFL